MKLIVLALCVCAAMADVHWDQSGQYRLIDNEPVDMYRILENPSVKLRINGPADARYRIIAAPIPDDYPLVYRYLNQLVYPSVDSRLGAIALKATQPFVYSYKQVNHGI